MFFFFFENEEYQDIGEFLKSKRLKKDLNQSELAEKMGVSQQSITYYESNKRIPSEKVITKYASVLGLNQDQLHYLRTQAVLGKELTDSPRRPDAVIDAKDGVYQLEFKTHANKERYKNTLETIDGAPLTQEELEKATEYIRALRIMQDRNTKDK